MKDPTTGKEVMRLNPESEWIRNAAPELRIVSDELWAAAKRQQEIVADRYVGIKQAAQAVRCIKRGVQPICSPACSNAAFAAELMPSSSETVTAV